MKVILLEDIKSLGKKGEIVDVSDGYARNFILKKKKGVEASAKNLNDLKLQKANDEKVAQENLDAALELAGKIADSEVVFNMKVGDNGKLFGAVATKEIAEAVKEQRGLDIDKKKIVIEEPIKTLGVHTVKIKLHKDVTAELKVNLIEG